VKAYAVDVNTSRTPEEQGTHSTTWPNGLIIMMMIIIITVGEGAHSPSWTNGLLPASSSSSSAPKSLKPWELDSL